MCRGGPLSDVAPALFLSGKIKHKPNAIYIPDADMFVSLEVFAEAGYKYIQTSSHKIIIRAPYMMENIFTADYFIAVMIKVQQ
jgi:hypothetical protein